MLSTVHSVEGYYSDVIISFKHRQPYLSAIDAVKQFEVNYIRPVDGSSGKDTNCIQFGSPKMFNCWVIEFSMKIDTKTKLVNGMSFDQAMTEGKDSLV